MKNLTLMIISVRLWIFIRGMPVHQKLGIISKGKVVQKLRLEKNVSTKKNDLLNPDK